MAGLRRRDFLTGAALGAVALLRPSGFHGTARADTARRGGAAPPRYWINVVPGGGIDAIWTTDPKTRREVKAGVDSPDAAEIVEAGDLRFGPDFRHLAARASQLTILNGVLVRTANHYTGVEQAARLRTKTTMRTPAVFDIIGAHRDSQSMAHVCLGTPLRQAQTLDFFGTTARNWFGGGANVFDLIGEMQPAQLTELSHALARHIRTMRGSRAMSADTRKMVDNIDQVRALLARLATTPPFVARDWLAPERRVTTKLTLEADLQRAVWLLEHDLAATVTVFTSFAWDSHADNRKTQGRLNPLLAALIDALLGALAETSTARGRLVDQTAVLVASEIGRFPYVNAAAGKDHFPQVPVIASGPAFAAGRQFGPTGAEMEALPISLDRGVASASGHRVILDDVGYTALRIAGIEPARYGFAGRHLRFLDAAEAG